MKKKNKKLIYDSFGWLKWCNLLSYIYDPSLPFKISKISKFSYSSPLRYTYQHTLFPTRKGLGVLNKQLNY
jgi:hypothetical protein